MKINDFYRYKKGSAKITMLTACDYSTAAALEASAVDCLLVGDSLAMTVYGYDSTIYATVELMANHTGAVRRAVKTKMIVSDMPFLSFRKGKYAALDAAGVLIKAGADAVKIENIAGHEETMEHLIGSGIPVMGHLGLTPQYVKKLGGYGVRGRDEQTAAEINKDALLLEKLGCFSVVLECVPAELAKTVTRNLRIPTIGIGSGTFTDGQVLVINDLLGLYPHIPSFVKKRLNMSEDVRRAANDFCAEVKAGVPTEAS